MNANGHRIPAPGNGIRCQKRKGVDQAAKAVATVVTRGSSRTGEGLKPLTVRYTPSENSQMPIGRVRSRNRFYDRGRCLVVQSGSKKSS